MSKFKIGDRVECLTIKELIVKNPTFGKAKITEVGSWAGVGYKEGKRFTIRTENNGKDETAYFPLEIDADPHRGVYGWALKLSLATIEEVEQDILKEIYSKE